MLNALHDCSNRNSWCHKSTSKLGTLYFWHIQLAFSIHLYFWHAPQPLLEYILPHQQQSMPMIHPNLQRLLQFSFHPMPVPLYLYTCCLTGLSTAYPYISWYQSMLFILSFQTLSLFLSMKLNFPPLPLIHLPPSTSWLSILILLLA